ncbi:hypothetical protein [Herbidospora cretacea]|uniref:hypothetical protein n=1 Tax=Herbidospora cretacea TaxID=28444 RepID=UPI0007C6F026|nr:hypothetical protein [Herbidospora cretacea]
MRRRRTLLLAALAGVLAVAAGVYAGMDRRAGVASRGREVMPFDLEVTTHRFAPSASGGVQTVTSDDPADVRQVTLIRAHLAEEAARLARGDYGDPAFIHGGEMPGLRQLQQGHGAVDVRYAEVPSGARITYRTTDPALITALHAWFDAQVTDHGRHAEHGQPSEGTR